MSIALRLVASHARFDGWTVRLEPLEGGGEQFHLPTRTATIDPTGVEPRLAYAHAAGHIALRHPYECSGGQFSEVQCSKADDSDFQDMLAASIEWAWSPEPVGLAEFPPVEDSPTIPKVDLV